MFRVLLIASVCVASGFGQSIAADLKTRYTQITGVILKSAEKMPEENFSFKPVDTVRTFGQVLGHTADAQYFFCSAAGGTKMAAKGVEKNAKTKEETIAGLKEAFAYCESVLTSMTDDQAKEAVKFFGQNMTKAGVITFNIGHTFEHYGNLVTYMRMKGLVPPSSERN